MLLTLPSGSSTYPSISVSDVFPNLPNVPCNFKPVKVSAILQNLDTQQIMFKLVFPVELCQPFCRHQNNCKDRSLFTEQP